MLRWGGRFLGKITCLLAALALAGCATVLPRNVARNAEEASRAVIPGIPHARIWGDATPTDLKAGLERYMPGLKRHAAAARIIDGRPHVDILALSGGGPDGAFGAGLLKGWSARGTRPTFDVVTGVSAGSIIAPFAFLGSAYDQQLEEIWTKYQTRELAIAQIVPAIFGGPALADTTPLQGLIEQYVDRKLLRAIAAEHARGRLLLVGTTNLDAQRPVYWNMGEIAASGQRTSIELFRKIILASAAIPGAFPPVAIEAESGGRRFEEMHVDGGTTRDVFVAPSQLKLSDLDSLYPVRPKRRVYIIMNGKMTPEFKPVKATAISIGARAISTLLKSHDSGDLYRISQQAAASGAEFHFVSIPQSFAKERQQTFDPAYQRALFETGEMLGRSGGGWRNHVGSEAGR